MDVAPVVLVVDDEPAIVDLMRDFLEAAGYGVATAYDAPMAMATLAARPIDCLLLDVMLPGPSGFDLCRQVREERDVPILFFSAREGDPDKLRGFGLGGDDYIAKSASPSEVVARVKAVLRRTSRHPANASDALLDFGRLVIDVRAHEVRVDGQRVGLTAREFAVLRLLAEHPRQVFTRDHIFERFWGDFGDRHTVTVHVGRIREKIEVDSARPQHLVTVWGVGYRFEGERR